MVRVEAGWALYSKRPRTHDDYGIISASQWPCSARDFAEIVTVHSTGEVPPGDLASGGAALPWVTFGAVRVSNEPLLCVIHKDWSGSHDATSRPIVATKVLCIRLADLQGELISLRNLYAAARPILQNWDLPREIGGPVVTMDVRPGDPGELAQVITNTGVTKLAATAAAVLGRDVSLLDGGPRGLEERLDFLDGVAAFLPAGAKAWLRSATWSERTSSGGAVVLAFARRATRGHVPLSLAGPPHEPADPTLLRYRDLLIEFCDTKGTHRVVRHLAGKAEVTKRDPAGALKALLELDLRAMLVTSARNRTMRVEDVYQYEQEAGLDKLDRQEKVDVLRQLISISGLGDLALVAKHWVADLYDCILDLAKTLAIGKNMLDGLFKFADEVKIHDALLADLIREGTAQFDDLIIKTVLAGQDGPTVKRVLAEDTVIPNRLVFKVLSRGDYDKAVELTRRLPGLYPMIHAVLNGHGGVVTVQNIAELDIRFTGKAVELIRICQVRWEEHSSRIMAPVCDWLLSGSMPHIVVKDRKMLGRFFEDGDLGGAAQARVDVLCYGFGGKPRTSVFDVVCAGNEDAKRYAKEFREASQSCPRPFREAVLTAVIKERRRDITTVPGVNVTLDMLRVLDPAWQQHGTDDVSLLGLVAEIVSTPDLPMVPTALNNWRLSFSRHPGILVESEPQPKQVPEPASIRARQQNTTVLPSPPPAPVQGGGSIRHEGLSEVARVTANRLRDHYTGEQAAEMVLGGLLPEHLLELIGTIHRHLPNVLSDPALQKSLREFERHVARALFQRHQVSAGETTEMLYLVGNQVVPMVMFYQELAVLANVRDAPPLPTAAPPRPEESDQRRRRGWLPGRHKDPGRAAGDHGQS